MTLEWCVRARMERDRSYLKLIMHSVVLTTQSQVLISTGEVFKAVFSMSDSSLEDAQYLLWFGRNHRWKTIKRRFMLARWQDCCWAISRRGISRALVKKKKQLIAKKKEDETWLHLLVKLVLKNLTASQCHSCQLAGDPKHSRSNSSTVFL